MAAPVHPFRQGLMKDYEDSIFNRERTHYKVGSGRSRQATRNLNSVLGDLQYHFTDRYGNDKERNELLHLRGKKSGALLRMSKKKYTEDEAEGQYTGLTRREGLAKYLKDKKNEQTSGKLHGDSEAERRRFHYMTAKSQRAHHYVVARPLLSYREENTDGKHCTYGQYKDGSRWRCVQNLNHKKGGGVDTGAHQGENNVRVHDKEDGSGPDRRTGLREPEEEEEETGSQDEAHGFVGSKRKNMLRNKKKEKEEEEDEEDDENDRGYQYHEEQDYVKLGGDKQGRKKTKKVLDAAEGDDYYKRLARKRAEKIKAKANEDTQPQDEATQPQDSGETKAERKKRITRENAQKQMADYNKDPPKKR